MRAILSHLFLPQETNNHRSRLLHHTSLLFIIAVLFISSLLISSVRTHYPQVLGVAVGISSDELLKLTNKERSQEGVSPLRLNTTLATAAQMKATDMFTKDYWSHNAPDGTTPWTFIKKSGYTYLYAGENLARGFTLSADIVTAWMESPTHRENMLSPNYKDVGFAIESGVLNGENTILVVEMLGGQELLNKKDQTSVKGVQEQPVKVAAHTVIKDTPIIDSNAAARTIGYSFLALFIFVLLLDMIIVERKKIVRFVGHNTDHIIFLCVIMLYLLILGRGFIL